LLVTGLGAIDFQKIVALDRFKVCESYQSFASSAAIVVVEVTPALVTNERVSAASNAWEGLFS